MKRKQQGFSLLEVACIILLMGIVGMAAVPSIHQVRKQETEQFVREMCLDFTKYRTKTKTDPSVNKYIFKLLPGSSGDNTGYSFTKDGESEAETKRNGAAGFKITVMEEQADGSFLATSTDECHFIKGTIKSKAETEEYQKVIIQVENDNVTRRMIFYTETGHYDIVQ